MSNVPLTDISLMGKATILGQFALKHYRET